MSSLGMTSFNPSAAQATPVQYASFARRLRGMFIDWALTLIVIFGALMIASSLRNDSVSRMLGIAVVITVLLYEPLLVSLKGGTIGHMLTNMRVVDDRHGGNISFPSAVVRFLIKSLIGWYSFILMATTRRHQAVHDLASRSTMQVRDAAKARPGQFVTERTELARPDMPPRWRRLLAIVGYSFVAFWLAYAVLIAISLIAPDTLSQRCVLEDVCTNREDRIANVVAFMWIAAIVMIVILGWRAKLFGARRGK